MLSSVCAILIQIGTCPPSADAQLQQLGSQPIFNPSMMPHWSRDHKDGQQSRVFFVFTVQNNHRCEILAVRKKNSQCQKKLNPNAS